MAKTSVITLDLNFQDKSQAIASYLIRDGDAVVLVESGPGSSLAGLEAGLRTNGLSLADVTHVSADAHPPRPRWRGGTALALRRADLRASLRRVTFAQPRKTSRLCNAHLRGSDGYAVGRVPAGCRNSFTSWRTRRRSRSGICASSPCPHQGMQSIITSIF